MLIPEARRPFLSFSSRAQTAWFGWRFRNSAPPDGNSAYPSTSDEEPTMNKLTISNGIVEIAGGFGRKAALIPLSAITEYRPRNGYRSLYIQAGSKTHAIHGSPDEVRGYVKALTGARGA
jgi:hypothetical protein